MSSPAFDFNQHPWIVFWELTRACDLACAHCRADAQTWHHPDEFRGREAHQLLDQIAELKPEVFVLTGGDPLKRDDLFELIDYCRQIGLPPSITPSATPLLTRDVIQRFQTSGIHRMALSLDAATEEEHDRFRGSRGSFARTRDAALAARDLGLPLQINTTVARHNWRTLDAIADLVEEWGARLWSVFFLIPVGRGAQANMLSAEENEQVFETLFRRSLTSPFAVKTTEAMHYRRYLLQQRKAGRPLPAVARTDQAVPRGLNDGQGLLFVSHVGEVYPSGFLPLSAGNVRRHPLRELYQNSPLFRTLRQPDLLKGRCGDCEFRKLCGGSRARAYALTGDWLESDPGCNYIPVAWRHNGTAAAPPDSPEAAAESPEPA